MNRISSYTYPQHSTVKFNQAPQFGTLVVTLTDAGKEADRRKDPDVCFFSHVRENVLNMLQEYLGPEPIPSSPIVYARGASESKDTWRDERKAIMYAYFSKTGQDGKKTEQRTSEFDAAAIAEWEKNKAKNDPNGYFQVTSVPD